MPEEMELNRGRRKQLAELMMGYPAGKSNRENLTQGETESERYYTCQNCKREFGTIMGKTSHLPHRPKGDEVLQKGEFENIRQGCSRNLGYPIELKEHRKYICIQRETAEPQEESTNEERAQQKQSTSQYEMEQSAHWRNQTTERR